MAVVYLALGANQGNRRRSMVTAAALLAERAGDVLSISSFYETEPWGFVSDNIFLNAALKLRTSLSPRELLAMTQEIEKELGRQQKSDGEYHDRPIDIDILLYDDLVMDTPELVIPHPLMLQRRFVMDPLVEIAPAVIHPVEHRRLDELMKQL